MKREDRLSSSSSSTKLLDHHHAGAKTTKNELKSELNVGGPLCSGGSGGSPMDQSSGGRLRTNLSNPDTSLHVSGLKKETCDPVVPTDER